MRNLLKIMLLAILLKTNYSAYVHPAVGVIEQPGKKIPLDAKFVNSKGDTVTLGELIKTPTLIPFVYYECPGICSPLLTDMARVAEKIDLKPGEDFKIITISFDPKETPEIAARWKKDYFDGMRGKFPEKDWYFLTGDSANIKKVTDAVGFYYIKNKRDGNFTHPDLVLAVSQKGIISRYIYGIQFNRFDLKMALLDAGAGKTSPAIRKLLQYCFSYDPEGRTYTLNITRIAGSIVLLGIFLFLIILFFKRKRKLV